MMGPKMHFFLPKNQHAQRKLFLNNPAMNYGSLKSAQIVLSMSKIDKKNSFKNYVFLLSCF